MKPEFNLLFVLVLITTFYASAACNTIIQLALIAALSAVGLIGSMMLKDLSTIKPKRK